MIVGFNVNSIDAEKSDSVGGDLQINYTPEIKDVSKTQVPAFDHEIIRVDFSFRVDYTSEDSVPAHIEMEGNILWNGNTDEIVKIWEDEGQLPEKIKAPLMNDLYRKLLSEATGIADTLSMIPPIPTPQIQSQ